MFSGPDFLYANAFFPKAKTYVHGRARTGRRDPRPHHAARLDSAPDLTQLRNSLRWILQYSYFITSQMSSDLQRGRLTGTLPVLYVFLARSGKTIREVSPSSSTRTAPCSRTPNRAQARAGPRRQDRVRRQRR